MAGIRDCVLINLKAAYLASGVYYINIIFDNITLPPTHLV
jgi:hypothetical protein